MLGDYFTSLTSWLSPRNNEAHLLGWLEGIIWNRVYIVLSTVPSSRAHFLFFFFSGALVSEHDSASSRRQFNTQSTLLPEMCSPLCHRTVLAMSWEHGTTIKGWILMTAGGELL